MKFFEIAISFFIYTHGNRAIVGEKRSHLSPANILKCFYLGGRGDCGRSRGTLLRSYWQWDCWWKKSCTTWHLGCINPVNNGIYFPYQQVQDFVHQQDVPANTAVFSMCFFVKEGPKLFGGSGQRLDLNSSRSSRLSFVKDLPDLVLKQFVKKFFLPFVKCSQRTRCRRQANQDSFGLACFRQTK